MAEEMRGVLALQEEIEKAKYRLKDVNENFKKITGRDPNEQRTPDRRNAGFEGRGRERIFNAARRNVGGNDGTPTKRRVALGGAFSRLGPRPARNHHEDSGDEDENLKHTVQSSVVAASAETRTKSIEQQSKDREGMARNRRMFGLILGTLQRFKTEAKDNKDKDDQRKKLEQKLDERAEKEKVEVRQQTRNLLDEMRLEQSKIRRLEQRMELVQEHEIIEKEMEKLSNFLCTKAKPPLFYMPRKKMSSDDAKLKLSAVFVKGLIDDKKKKMENEIEEMMTRENEREERIRSRIAERTRRQSGPSTEEHMDDDEEHHDDEDDEEDGEAAVARHKASRLENKENELQTEEGTQEGTQEDVEMPEEANNKPDEEGKNGDNRDEPVVTEGGDQQVVQNPDIEMEEDGGMVNTVGGVGNQDNTENESSSRRKSDQISEHSKSVSKRRHRSVERSERRHHSDRHDKHRRDRKGSHSKERREEKSRHSKRHREEKPKPPRHDTEDEEEEESDEDDDEEEEEIDQPVLNLNKIIKTEKVSMNIKPKEEKPDISTLQDVKPIMKTEPCKSESDEDKSRKITMAEDEEEMDDDPADE